MLTVEGVLQIGVDGQKDFTAQVLTADDTIAALEQAIAEEGEGASLLRVRKYELAQVVRVGGKLLTVKQVGALWHKDYDTINQKMGEAEKKLLEQSVEVLAEIKPNPPSELLTS